MKAIKELGQHFLIDPTIAEKIAALGDIQPSETIWEIGPGLGILSEAILRQGVKLKAFELDKRMAEVLETRFGDTIQLKMIDILKLNWQEELSVETNRIKLIANIPYQITSPLLYLLEKHHTSFECIVMMVQKEVADRLSAVPGNKSFGLITLRLGLLYQIQTALFVGKEMFDPVPKVDSAVIVMKPRQIPPQIGNPELFHKLFIAAFAHRRKTLKNNLIPLIGRPKIEQLEHSCNIELNRRAETLNEAEFIYLSDLIATL